ncbi:rod shape-determining protein MreC [sulfur-oxidizing endosymbiont of Gigantopelta aegis]|uniref:rod shape-determining protein MreC n=1 Tax=sulfur-oxidizing endosymbiont of Gigantopelta aegis TaxID=2794934 RepID=UPI0024833D3F|nr:rod shape-determining protein MreC [sulfur-oxidizing endosymbiont of Gigantopelta aegis]
MARLIFVIVLSVIMMSADHRTNMLDNVRSLFGLLIYPLQTIASIPTDTGLWLEGQMDTRQSLIAENEERRTENLLLKAQLQKFTSLQAENIRLRSLLKSSRKLSDQMLIAETVAVDLDPYKRQIVINKGLFNNVYSGQPILDAYGIMGQVINPGIPTSTAILITDPSHAIPVQINRNGLRTVLYGTGAANYLEVQNLPNNADIEIGDLLITSGLGGRFPEGYPVARVVNIKRDPGQPFAQIIAEASAHLEQSREVLLVMAQENAPQLISQQEPQQVPQQKSKPEKALEGQANHE